MKRLQGILGFGLSCTALVLLSLGVGPARADDEGEWEREADPDLFFVSPVDSDGHPTHVVVRVVDDQTGEALPGATVALHADISPDSKPSAKISAGPKRWPNTPKSGP